MITVEQMASVIATRINSLTADYTFNVMGTEGEYSRSTTVPKINAVAVELPSQIAPVQGFNAYYCTLDVRMPVKTQYQAGVNAILHDAVNSFRGVVSQMTDAGNMTYACVTNCSMPSAGGVEITGLGETVTFSFSVYFQFVESGVLSNNCVYKLNGYTLTEIDGATARVRIEQADNVINSQEIQSIIGQQLLQHNFTIPYLNNDLCKQLVNDIMQGNLDKTYTLEYSDGITYLSAAPLSIQVVLKNGTMSRQAGKVVTLQLQFVIANSSQLG